jgi:hypothetical protein
MNERVLGRMHQAYKDSVHQYAGGHGRAWITRFALAAVILIAAGALVNHFARLLGGNVAWAEVSQRFESVPFFYASIYMKEDALAEPRQFELWMGRGGYARLRVGPQVIFGRDGQVIRAFDIRRRHEVAPDPTAADIVHILAGPGEFSLETIIQSISGGKLVDVTPAMNTHAAIGEDLVVFDAQSAISPGWVRVYALRESRLPVGLRIWDPAEGFGVDALINYAKEQPQVFFDPQAFAERLHEADSTDAGLAYLFLKDPGGLDVTPTDLLE